MPENKYLVRAPLLDPKQHVLGYKLAWQKKRKSNELSSEIDQRHLLAFVAEHASPSTLGLLFLDASSAVLSAEVLQTMSPETTVLMLKRDDLHDAGHVALATSLREQGFGLALRDPDLAFLKANELLLSHVTYVLICFDHPDLTAITSFARNRQSPFFVSWINFPAGGSSMPAPAWVLLGFLKISVWYHAR